MVFFTRNNFLIFRVGEKMKENPTLWFGATSAAALVLLQQFLHKPKLWLSQLLCKWASFKAGKLGISGQRKLHNKSLNIFHEIYIDLIWPNAYIFSYDVCSALHWLNNGVMLIHSGRWPLIIFSWADRETKSWCNFWAADWKKLKRNLNAHRPDLLVFLILLKMSWQPLAQTCQGTLLVYQGGKLFRVPKPTPTDMSLCCFQTRQGPPTAC